MRKKSRYVTMIYKIGVVIMEKYIPDIYQKSIYAIDYQKLASRGIKCLLVDLDNTLVATTIKKPNQKIKNLFHDLKEQGFRIILFSNSSKHRLKPFGDELEVEYCYRAFKPRSKKYRNIMQNYHLEESQVAMIGDQLLTDIVGGNRVGITTILVNPVSNHDGFFTRFNRMYERYILKKLRERTLFTKGKYYD